MLWAPCCSSRWWAQRSASSIQLNPASIFLGDTGSLFLGFILALTSTHIQKSFTLFSIVAAFVALALPIFDLSMAVIRRYLTGKPVFGPPIPCTPHPLAKGCRKSKQPDTAGGATVLGGFALLFIFSSDRISALRILALVAVTIVAITSSDTLDIIRAGRRTLMFGTMEQAASDRNAKVAEIRNNMLQAEDEEDLWRHLVPAGKALGLESLRFEIPAPATNRHGAAHAGMEAHKKHRSRCAHPNANADRLHGLIRKNRFWNPSP